MGSMSEISEQAAVSQDATISLAAGQRAPDGLLPYSSAGNAVPPHCVPYGRDISRRIRQTRKKKKKTQEKRSTQGTEGKFATRLENTKLY